MRSKVAEEVREQQWREMQAMTADERMSLSLELGQRALETYMSKHGVSRDEALTALLRESQHGRRYSRCMRELDGYVDR